MSTFANRAKTKIHARKRKKNNISIYFALNELIENRNDMKKSGIQIHIS